MPLERDLNRDWALRLAEVGIAVFPCGPDKKPLVKWQKLSSADADAVADLWAQHRNALPAIDLEKSDLVVLDGDRHGGPDGRAALRELLDAQPGFDRKLAPCVVTPADGAHIYFSQNGHELTNARGDLPEGIDVRGAGGYVICPYAVLPDGRRYRAIPKTPDLISAYKAGTIPPMPEGVVALLEARKKKNGAAAESDSGRPGIREQSYAAAALEGCTKELAAAASGQRNELLNALAYRLGRMVARGWLHREHVEANLSGAMHVNGYVSEEGIRAVEATLRSGLDAGIAEPHPDLADDSEPAPVEPKSEPPQHPPCGLDEVHAVFRKWLGKTYDIDTLDAVLATAAAARLPGDPLWLVVISGSGNAKTETVQALAGAGAVVTSTISSEGALLSGTASKQRTKGATGGLLRQLGDRGLLVLKDLSTILSMDRHVRGAILAALREIYDGRWQRNLGVDGGRTLTWEGRITVVGACTTIWDSKHGVIAAMGDRFILIRPDSKVGRIEAGTQAIANIGHEVEMRGELAAAVGGLLTHVDSNANYALQDGEQSQLIKAANVVTHGRTAVERDYRGDVIDNHDPEMPTRLTKQLSQLVRGALALGMRREAAMRLALRCARDSFPPLRSRILLDLARAPESRAADVNRRLGKPRATVRRELEALHALELLRCTEEEVTGDDGKTHTVWRYSLAEALDRNTLLAMLEPPPF